MSDVEMKATKVFPASVERVLDSSKIVINRGVDDNLKLGQWFLIYAVSDEEIRDPDTNESLGYLEIPKGTGKVTQISSNSAVVEFDELKYNFTNTSAIGGVIGWVGAVGAGIGAAISPKENEFKNPKVGDLAKPI
ncbi:hypothetical protein Pse7367_3275 [Thalassoporum mexicanum PCC 7367]|uniref:hypothetical protein n=1 Tax=Thalassoporum mexicanum TaxID=3457544 RepID=UPI00029F9349|nr:hypothetical protein [Pseudanabaena sp. PCC 7367]AFY71516.1 hypothetical protein Pse7367_3275 [Pseudanabaena sp. PCC 7367]